MPWKETCAMSERECFVEEAMMQSESFSRLCERYEISRKTGYKWLDRHRDNPEGGLRDRRSQRIFGSRFGEDVIATVCDLRAEHRTWGPEKLVARLRQADPSRQWPSASAVKGWLRKRGESRPRRNREACPVEPRRGVLRPMNEPNAVWCMDFKGWFYTGDRRMCEALTLMDGYSRYLLNCEIVPNRRYESVRSILERVFWQYGRPQALRSDNGPPFGSQGLASLTPLSVWLITQGIYPEKIRAGHPEENARQERLHRTLKAETAAPPARNHQLQQERFDTFRQVYNQERPHAALGQTVPAAHYRSGYAGPVRIGDYSGRAEVGDVDSKGYLRFSVGRIYLSESLSGRQVGVMRLDESRWELDFLGYRLGEIDAGKLRR